MQYNKYELDLTNYVPLKYLNLGKIETSDYYKINIEKVTIINNRHEIIKQTIKDNGYMSISIHGKTLYVHRVIWFHCNGVIPDDLEIDHIDSNRKNNTIDNLQLLTHQQNLLKSAKNRDYSFTKTSYSNKHRVKATDTETGKYQILASLYACRLYYNINCGIVKMCCEKKNNCKSGISKNNNHKIVFEYTDEPLTLVNKHYNRFYKPEEAVVQNQEYMKRKQKKYMSNYHLDRRMTKTIQQYEIDSVTHQIQITDKEFDSIIKEGL